MNPTQQLEDLHVRGDRVSSITDDQSEPSRKWFLVKDGMAFLFSVEQPSVIKITQWILQDNNRYWHEQPHHDDYANGFYPQSIARNFWYSKVAEGFIKAGTL